MYFMRGGGGVLPYVVSVGMCRTKDPLLEPAGY